MSVKLVYSYPAAHEAGEDRHAQTVMRELGYNVLSAEPNSMFEHWIFEVDEVKEPLPPYLGIVRELAESEKIRPDFLKRICVVHQEYV